MNGTRIRMQVIEVKAQNPDNNRFRLKNAGAFIVDKKGEPSEFYSRDAVLRYVQTLVGKHNEKFAGKISAELAWHDGQLEIIDSQRPPIIEKVKR